MSCIFFFLHSCGKLSSRNMIPAVVSLFGFFQTMFPQIPSLIFRPRQRRKCDRVRGVGYLFCFFPPVEWKGCVFFSSRVKSFQFPRCEREYEWKNERCLVNPIGLMEALPFCCAKAIYSNFAGTDVSHFLDLST